MSKRKISILISFFIFLSSAFIVNGEEESPVPGLSLDQIKSIIDTASGERALTHIRQLSLFHRWFVSEGYYKAAAYIQKKAQSIGLKNVEIEKFPADGKLYYSTNKSYPHWSVKSASLTLVSPERKHLVSWAENPIVLASNSRSGDVTARLVDVGKGISPSDYEGKDVEGKLVLASCPQGEGRIELVHRLAVLERGAAGVISYRSYYLDDFPDLITWDHIWTYSLGERQSTFGFCISKRMGWELQRLLREGEDVRLHAKVDAELSAGHYEIVKAAIPGSDLAEQEIWFTAHLDHCLPSANDNASGSAAILEIARTIKNLCDSGVFPGPRRTLRFFWVPEICGSYAYIAKHLSETRRAVTVINMDMVGENQVLCGSTFRVTQTPDSTPSFLNDLLHFNLDFLLAHNPQPGKELTDPLAVVSLMGSRENWKANVIPYSGGSDHYVFMGGVINIPATMLGSWPDYYYHSSGDTPDKSDPTQLKRASVYGTMVAASIMNLDSRSGLELVERIFPRSIQRMDKAAEQAWEGLRNSDLTGRNLRDALNKLHWIGVRETKTLRSVNKLLPDNKKISSLIERRKKEISDHVHQLGKTTKNIFQELCQDKGKEVGSFEVTQEEKAAHKLIPLRNPAFPGPLESEYVEKNAKEKGLKPGFSLSGSQLYEIGAFIDGEKSALDIFGAVNAEYGPLRLKDLVEYLEILEKIDLISFK